MSVKAMTWVFEHSEAKANDRLVLLYIADQANDNGVEAFPKHTTIAKAVRADVRTIPDCITRLERLGELLVLRPAIRGRGRHNKYALVMGRDPHALRAMLGWPADENTVSPSPIPTPPETCENTTVPEAGNMKAPSRKPESPRSRPVQALTRTSNPPPPTRARDAAPSPGEGDHAVADGPRPSLRDDAEELAAWTRTIRREHGLPHERWTARNVCHAIDAAIDAGYPEHAIVPALEILAADPDTHLPGRLKGAGPWWDARWRDARIAVLDRHRATTTADHEQRRHDHQVAALNALPTATREDLRQEALQAEPVPYDDPDVREAVITARMLDLAADLGLITAPDDPAQARHEETA